MPGKPLPLGATVMSGGVNFSVFSRNGTSVILELFDGADDDTPALSVTLDPKRNRTGDVWHVFCQGLSADALYLYRVDGPFRPNEGLRFNVNKYLLDPYAKALTRHSIFKSLEGRDARTPHIDQDLAYSSARTASGMPKCVVVDDGAFDWEGDRPLNYPLRYTVLYEAHVKGSRSIRPRDFPMEARTAGHRVDPVPQATRHYEP
jgi:glycogen operon protein